MRFFACLLIVLNVLISDVFAVDLNYHGVSESHYGDYDAVLRNSMRLLLGKQNPITSTNTNAQSKGPYITKKRRRNQRSFVSPTRRDQGQNPECFMFAGATFVRSVIRKHHPKRWIPEHRTLFKRIRDQWEFVQTYRVENRLKVSNLDQNMVLNGILSKYDLCLERVKVTETGWRRELQRMILDREPMYVLIKGKYWKRISNALQSHQRRGKSESTRMITLFDIESDPPPTGIKRILSMFGIASNATTIFRNHAVVFDPDQTLESGLWTFKNSHGDGVFHVTDQAMNALITNQQLLFYW